MTAIPCPIGMFPIDEPDHLSSGSTMPALSPGKSIPVRCPKPKREIQRTSRCRVNRSARVIAPTLDERERISETVIVSVPRGSASWILRSATWISYGSVNRVVGVTSPSDRAPATVTSLKVEPGS